MKITTQSVILPVTVMVMLLFVFKASAIDYSINFSAAGASTTIDSIVVQNLTKGTRLTVSGGSSLQLTALNQTIIKDTKLNIYPNPIIDKANVKYYSNTDGNIQINVFGIDGRSILFMNKGINCGVNHFELSLPKGIFTIQINNNGIVHSAKVLSISNNMANINLVGEEKKSNNSVQKIKFDGIPMQNNFGDIFLFKAYSGKNICVLTEIISQSKTINFNFVECKDIDGNYYPTVTIGNQVWMAENLRTAKYRNNSAITDETNNANWETLTTEAYSNYNSDVNNLKYGKLYNWYAVKNPNGLAPMGWHIPTNEDWNTLTNFLGGYYCAGNKLKESSNTNWVANNIATTNETGFTALPGGFRQSDNSMISIGRKGFWWSATESMDHNYASCWSLNSQYVTIENSELYKNSGLSIRCVKGGLLTVKTYPIQITSPSTVVSGGLVYNDGAEVVIQRGVCWSTSPNPTIADNTTLDGEGSGTFTSSITGLTTGIRYYQRAYAINSTDTVYGNEICFLTIPNGFYISGTATPYTTLELAGIFNNTPQENYLLTQRDGLVDKFVTLTAGNSYNIYEVTPTLTYVYGPSNDFKPIIQKGEMDQMEDTIQMGSYAQGGTFTVPTDGLYHIAIDKQTKSIVVMPANVWSILGSATLSGWSDTNFKSKGTFNKDTLGYEITDLTLIEGEYKFRHSNAWVQTIASNPLIRIHTNFGGTSVNNIEEGGQNIQLPKSSQGKYTVNASWGRNSGMKFSITKTAEVIYPDPTTLVISLIGDAFDNALGVRSLWDYDLDLVQNPTLSVITNMATKAGTYVYTAKNVQLFSNGLLKVRENHEWRKYYGYVQTNIIGDDSNFIDSGDGNIKVLKTSTYSSIDFILKLPEETWQLRFSK